MSLDMVLNELSFVPLSSRREAQEKMSELMQIVAYLSVMEVRGALRYSPVLFSHALYSGYTVADWINDSQVDRETRRKFLTTATKSPFLADEPLAEARKSGYEFAFESRECEALGAAYLLDVPALSLDSGACWQSEKLEIQITQIDGNSGEVLEFDGEIIHVAKPEHTKAHQEWIRRRLSSPVKTGVDIWINRNTLYPKLEFCVEVEKQLQQISLASDLKQIQYRLEALQQYDDIWTDERIKIVLPNFSGESQTTMNNYAHYRNFTRPNGEIVCCEWHMKMMKSNLRLHFYWDKKQNVFVVGYIGTHLPI